MTTPTGTMGAPFRIDPRDYLDFKFDFKATTNASDTTVADALDDGETISSYTLTEQTGLVVDNDSLTDTNTSVTYWVAPADTASGTLYVEIEATTSSSRIFNRKAFFLVVNR